MQIPFLRMRSYRIHLCPRPLLLYIQGSNLRPNSRHGNPNFQLAINLAFWTPLSGPPQLQQANRISRFTLVECKWVVHSANEGGGQWPSPCPRSDMVT